MLLIITWSIVSLREIVGLPLSVSWIVLIIPFLGVLQIAVMAGLILSERLWKLVGVYRLLKVTGSPIESGFASFGGVIDDG